jgi:hypothetical protein
VGRLANIGRLGEPYHGYILAIFSSLEGPIQKVLRENFDKLGELIGVDNVLAKPHGKAIREVKNLLIHLGLNVGIGPCLLISDKHPLELVRGDRVIFMDLGNLNQEQEALRVFIDIARCLTEENFISSLSWQQRKRKLMKVLSGVKDSVSITLAVAGL